MSERLFVALQSRRGFRRIGALLHRRLWRLCETCRAYDDAGRDLGFWK